MRPFVIAIFALSAAFGCTPGEDDRAAPDDSTASPIADVAKNYRHLQSMTPQPVFVDPGLAMLCRGVSENEVEAARKRSGPHGYTAIRIYMNDVAANAFRKLRDRYPVGSVIVKEKQGVGYESKEGKPARTRDGVGGMVKRPPGFDSAHGDWEYFYFEDPAKIESGRIASCVKCHSGASDTDYVFGGWAREKSN